MTPRSQHGFTIIELIVVIALLALLAAVALPKFADLTSEARTASLNGVRGGYTAAVQIAHSKWIAGGTGLAGNVNLEGVVVHVNAAGWPDLDATIATQDTASELYGLLMSGPLPANWTPAEDLVLGTATFQLTGTGGGTFVYTYGTGLVS